MNLQEELQLFKRYTTVFTGDSTAVIGIASVHLARQLEKYLNPSLDLGRVIGCILDINSTNMYSNSREVDYKSCEPIKHECHPEYKYAEFIIKLCVLFLMVNHEQQLTEEEANAYILTEHSEFYFGEQLSMLNKNLLSLACRELSVAN